MYLRVAASLTCAGGLFVPAACTLAPPIPDQREFESLDSLARSDQAVARIYGSPIPGLEWLAIHTWVVVKSADKVEFERWEVLPEANGVFGHVQKDRSDPSTGFGDATSFVIAERIGASAETVVRFVQVASPTYPCRHRYIVYPGPDSNTYTQWVINKSGWPVYLPFNALGKDAVIECPQPYIA